MKREELVNDRSKLPKGCKGMIRKIENCSKVDNGILVIKAWLTLRQSSAQTKQPC